MVNPPPLLGFPNAQKNPLGHIKLGWWKNGPSAHKKKLMTTLGKKKPATGHSHTPTHTHRGSGKRRGCGRRSRLRSTSDGSHDGTPSPSPSQRLAGSSLGTPPPSLTLRPWVARVTHTRGVGGRRMGARGRGRQCGDGLENGA